MKIIKLKPNGVGRYDNVSPFIVTDNRLELQIELPNFNGEFYLVYELNSKTDKRLLHHSGQIILEDLAAGEFNAEVKHYIKGELIKVYKVEPLLLKEVDGTLSALPEIEELKREIAALRLKYYEDAKVARSKEQLRNERLQEELAKLDKNLFALIKFAYSDFKNNVYLEGGSFEQFMDKFGFALTDLQIKLIKGEKEDEED